MSTSLDVMTEKNFKNLMTQYTSNYIEEPIELIEKLSQHYTCFSGNINRLYDVVYEGEQIINDFSKEENLTIFKLSKEKIINIINKSNNSSLIEKWEYIMESFDDCNSNDILYFIFD